MQYWWICSGEPPKYNLQMIPSVETTGSKSIGYKISFVSSAQCNHDIYGGTLIDNEVFFVENLNLVIRTPADFRSKRDLSKHSCLIKVPPRKYFELKSCSERNCAIFLNNDSQENFCIPQIIAAGNLYIELLFHCLIGLCGKLCEESSIVFHFACLVRNKSLCSWKNFAFCSITV